MRPFFSIGVTTYDRHEMLKECLSSILRQTFLDFEVIVGNDYTLDTLSAKLLGIDNARIRFVNHPQNLGELGNANSLLGMSQGRYFTWLADDDMYVPTFLEAMHTAIAKFNSPFCVFSSFKSGATFHGEIENSVRQGQLFKGSQFVQLYLSRKLKAIGCYGVFDREYIRQTGGMEQLGEGFSPYSDNLLAIRAGVLKKVIYIDAPLILFRTHKQSISFVSPDVDAYSSAQIDLLPKGIEVFRSEGLSGDFHSNLFLLLKWCLYDYCEVIHRSGLLWREKLINYMSFMMKYTRMLRRYRYRMIIRIVYCMSKLTLQVMMSQLKVK